MSFKLIALGNRLMGDDSVAIHVAERLMNSLVALDGEVIIGETDMGFVYGRINAGDIVLILDAMESGNEPGKITVVPLASIKASMQGLYSQHQSGLYSLLQLLPFPVWGYLIGIEVEEVYFGMKLSQKLAADFDLICAEVLAKVVELTGLLHIENM